MNSILNVLLCCFIFLFLHVFTIHAAPFRPGDLAVLRSGDGLATLTNISTAFFLDEFQTNGQLVQTIAIPSTGSNSLVISGNAVAEASLMRTPNGRWICFSGYHGEPGFTNITTSTSSQVPRSIGTVDGTGKFTLVAASPGLFNTFSIRSGASDGTNSFWGAGAVSGSSPGGLDYFGFDGPTNTINQGNIRVLNLINGSLYDCRGGVGVSKYNGLPKTAATRTLFVSETGSPYGFAINPAGNVAYIADDAQSSSGGILRFTNSAGIWSLVYTLGAGVANTGVRGLTVDWSGPDPVLYASTSENSIFGNPTNRLIRIVDSGINSVATTLATAPGSSSFRGVAFAPEAYSLGISVTGNNVVITPSTNSVGAVLETVTNLTFPLQWTAVWTNSGQEPPSFPMVPVDQQFFRLRF
jgi:hypothetical protein